MVKRRCLVVAAVPLVLIVSCSSDANKPATSPPADSSAGATSDSTPATSASSVDAAASSVPDTVADTAGNATTDVTAGTSATVPAGADGELAGLATLTTDQVCALLPKDEVEQITGKTVSDPAGTAIAGLGTNCLYYDAAASLDLVAKLEFNAFDWQAITGLLAISLDGTPTATPCSIGGRDAFCQDTSETRGITNDAAVYVKLGGDHDPVLFVSSSAGLATATQLAEDALANLAPG